MTFDGINDSMDQFDLETIISKYNLEEYRFEFLTACEEILFENFDWEDTDYDDQFLNALKEFQSFMSE